MGININSKILLSVASIAAAAALVIGATFAFFSDTETSTGNTFTAGTIDISVDETNPWSTEGPVTIDDMKPSYVRWTRHTVKNVGNNPLKLWKHIKDVETEENGVNEPEQDWYNENNGPKNDIDTAIEYDMYVGGNVVGEGADESNNWLGGSNSGGTVVIDEEDGITIADIESVFVFLGELAPNDEIVVWQSYHMKDETGNWAQTDSLTFTIEFYAEQVNGPGPTSTTLLLENKTGDPDWNVISGDGTWGILKWVGDGNTFDFSTTLEAHGLQPSTNYSLIYYADPWPGNNPGALFGTGDSTASGDLTIAANPNLGIDLPDLADDNYPTGAKIWLIPSSAYNAGANSVITWPPANDWLFEYNLIKYDDTDN